MTQAKLTSGDLNGYGGFTGGNDGTLVVEVGPAGGKVNAISIDASGNATILGNIAFQGRSAWNPGEVIQMLSFPVDAGGSTTAGAVANVSASSKTITPKSTNSIIVVLCTFQGTEALLAATNTVGTFQLMQSGSVIGNQYTIGVANGSGNNRSETAASITARLTNAALTTRSFTIGAATSNASAAASATNQMFTIWEIQQ